MRQRWTISNSCGAVLLLLVVVLRVLRTLRVLRVNPFGPSSEGGSADSPHGESSGWQSHKRHFVVSPPAGVPAPSEAL